MVVGVLVMCVPKFNTRKCFAGRSDYLDLLRATQNGNDMGGRGREALLGQQKGLITVVLLVVFLFFVALLGVLLLPVALPASALIGILVSSALDIIIGGRCGNLIRDLRIAIMEKHIIIESAWTIAEALVAVWLTWCTLTS